MKVPKDGMIRRITTVATPQQRTLKRDFKIVLRGPQKVVQRSLPLHASFGGVMRSVGSVQSIGTEGSVVVGTLHFDRGAFGENVKERYSFGVKQPLITIQDGRAVIAFS